MLQLELENHLVAILRLPPGTSVSLRPSADCVRPTYTTEGNLLYSYSTDLMFISCKKNTFSATSRPVLQGLGGACRVSPSGGAVLPPTLF